MRLVEVLQGDCAQGDLLPRRSGIEEWEQMKSTLETKLGAIRKSIIAAREEFPYAMRECLKDHSWVELQNRKIRLHL